MAILARKRFGQNFLQDAFIIHSIIGAIQPQPGEKLIEIGPGRGALTFPLLKQASSLMAVEIDRDLVAYLESFKQTKLRLIEADALTLNYTSLCQGQKTRFYGNLPYNIATPLLLHLLSFVSIIQDGHFMVQKEVADRITASPGSKDYGRLSVMIQYFCQAEKLLSVPPEAFFPRPKVESTVICLKPHAISPYPEVPIETLSLLVKESFAHRRKTLKNNLKALFSEQDWEKLGINSQLRPEQLSVGQFVKMARHMLY